MAVVIALTLFHSLVQGPALSRLREAGAGAARTTTSCAGQIRAQGGPVGIVSALNLLATLAILVLAARLMTVEAERPLAALDDPR